MKGRREHEEKTFRKVSEKLKNYPDYMRLYYESLTDKSYTTKDVYVTRVLHFLKFLESRFGIDTNNVKSFKDVRPSHISSYINSLGDMTEAAKSSRLYAVKNFFRFLSRDGYVDASPFKNIDMPKDNAEHKITYLTKEEIAKVKQNIMDGVGNDLAKNRQKDWKTRDYAIVMVALSLGLRVTSLTEIDLDDIDFVNKEIKIVEKGNKIRSMAFGDNLSNIIQDWLADRAKLIDDDTNRALFISKRRDRITSNTIAAIIKKYTYNIDKHITPHKLRSTCATNIYNSTGDIYLTSYVLGHSDVAVTKRYTQVSEEKKKKAATAMDDILF